MTRGNRQLLKTLGKLWSYVDRGHLFLVALTLGTYVYYSNTLEKITVQRDKTVFNLQEDLQIAKAKIFVLEEEFLYGEIDPKILGPQELDVHIAYLEKKEAIIRGKVIPLLTAQIEELMPKGKKARTAWEAADLPQPEKLANIFYDNSRKYNHDPTVLISIGWAESRFRADICSGKKKSSAGAVGCMQVMPQWVKKLDFIESTTELASNIEKNIEAGAYIFREYLDHKYGRGRTLTALRLYNYGPKRYRYKVRKKTKFNGYAQSVIKKVKELHNAVPVEITVQKTVKVKNLNPL